MSLMPKTKRSINQGTMNINKQECPKSTEQNIKYSGSECVRSTKHEERHSHIQATSVDLQPFLRAVQRGKTFAKRLNYLTNGNPGVPYCFS